MIGIAGDSSFAIAGLVSALIGLIASAVLWLFFMYGWMRRISGRAALAAMSGTLLWQATLLGSYMLPARALQLTALAGLLELITYLLWFGVCLRVLGVGAQDLRSPVNRTRWGLAWASIGIGVATIAVGGAHAALFWFAPENIPPPGSEASALDTARLLSTIMGLVLLEQVAGNTRRDHQWNLKYLVLGLGIPFGYGFVMYSDAVLFRVQSPALAAAHGSLIALALPFLMIATIRNSSHQLRVNLSRQLAFRTGALLATGTYLMLIGAGGYWLRAFGGDWGEVLAVLFVTIAMVVAVVLAASRTLRERFSLALARNLFEQKHDYRAEWLRITDALITPDVDASLAERSVRALGELVHAHRGAIWQRASNDVLEPVAQHKTAWRDAFAQAVSAELCRYFEAHPGPVVLGNAAVGLESPPRVVEEALSRLPDARIAVPLLTGDRLYGLVVLTEPETGEELGWEDDEILGVAGRQVASFLAQRSAQDALSETRQLDAFNQMTAFVVHDIKTVVAQLSLLTRNAEKHRDKPEFIDDMIATTHHAVGRMQSLLEHLKNQRDAAPRPHEALTVEELLNRVAERQSRLAPRPRIIHADTAAAISCEPELLLSAIAHLVQNGQEAAGAEGDVSVAATVEDDRLYLRIDDDGCGMTSDFLQNQLFRPFQSTKGVAGMGVGTWQAREYVRRLGGDIQASSQVGAGTTMNVTLPLNAATAVRRPQDSHQERSPQDADNTGE